MQTAQRRRARGWAIAASIVVHIAVGVVALLQRPTLPPLIGASAPPEPIIPILIMPRTPPQAAGQVARPSPIRLHRRPQPFIPPDVTPAPIAPPTPPAQAQAPAGPKTLPALHPAPEPEGPKGDVKNALRQSYVGCANPLAVGLTRAERDLCDEKLGKGAKDTAFAGLGLNADKQRALDAAGAKKEDDYRYKRGGAVPTVAQGSLGSGMSAEQMCGAAGVSPDECGVHLKQH
jgi:hypothetical protein